jgi:mono/diheme cytochrome c family protein
MTRQYRSGSTDPAATLPAVIRRSSLLLLALAATLGLVLSACGGDSEPGGEQSEGQAVYSANCARCHGPDGEGGVGPKLNDGAVVENFPDIEDQLAIIREGRAGMPAWEDSLTPEEIQAVADYTREDLG